jgi:hypothetical protein
MGDSVGRFQERLKVLALRMVSAWRSYSDFIEGQERANAIRFESQQMKPTWIIRSDVDEELSRTPGGLDFRMLSRFYPHGFEFRRRFVRERLRTEDAFHLRVEVELVSVFSHGDFFRPETRCRIEPELLPQIFEDLESAALGRVFVLQDLQSWLKEIGFADFMITSAKALLIDLGSRGAWVVVDPRPEVFSRPVAERLAQALAAQFNKVVSDRGQWNEMEL